MTAWLGAPESIFARMLSPCSITAPDRISTERITPLPMLLEYTLFVLPSDPPLGRDKR